MATNEEKKPIRSEYLAMALLCIVIAIFIVVLIVVSSYKANNKVEESSMDSSSEVQESSDDVSETTSEESKETYGTIQIASSGKNSGVLAITQVPETDAEPEDLVQISSKYNQTFGLSTTKLYLLSTPMDALNAMTAAFKEAKGETSVIVDKAYTSYSSLTDKEELLDLTTGYSVLFSIYPVDKDGDTFSSGKYTWFADNANSYGFILRYPTEKAEITGHSGNNRLFRFVGYAHASYMGTFHMCLEEYLEKIRSYTYENPLTFAYANASGEQCTCSVYFVKAAETQSTKIMIPEGAKYAVSGNGTDGFIVTIYNAD